MGRIERLQQPDAIRIYIYYSAAATLHRGTVLRLRLRRRLFRLCLRASRGLLLPRLRPRVRKDTHVHVQVRIRIRIPRSRATSQHFPVAAQAISHRRLLSLAPLCGV